MPCFSPLRAYRAPGGQITFSRKAGWSDRPLDLACGQCIGCRLEKARQWTVRCVHEAQMHDSNCFLTLTYSPAHLPLNGGLRVRDWQLFAKRLRKRVGKFRYMHCGEYGDENQRPHYHALLFGQDFSSDRVHWKGEGATKLYTSAILEDCWGLGFCTIGSFSFQTAAYVSRYILKKVTGANAPDHYQRVDADTGEVYQVKPEYVSMSRRPGLGSSWFDKFSSDVYPRDEVVLEGKRYRPPRFYDSKLPEKVLKDLKVARLTKARGHADDQTPDRLLTREKCAEAKADVFSRSL